MLTLMRSLGLVSEHACAHYDAGSLHRCADVDEVARTGKCAEHACAHYDAGSPHRCADVDEVARTGKCAEWAGRYDRTGFGFFDRPGGLMTTDDH